MNGNSHFMFGAACGTMLAVNMDKIETVLPELSRSPATATLFVFGGLIGGILPDIDNPNSYIGKLTVPLSTFVGHIQKAFGKTDSKHRGLLHDPIVYVIGLILSYLYFTPITGLFVGCLTHIFLDLFNPSGVPFLFGIKHLRLAKICSGSKESIIFTWVVTIAVVVIGIMVKILSP